VGSFHYEALGLQVFADQSAELDVVIDHQNAFHSSGFHCAPASGGQG
jgi:hypothetical protein